MSIVLLLHLTPLCQLISRFHYAILIVHFFSGFEKWTAEDPGPIVVDTVSVGTKGQGFVVTIRRYGTGSRDAFRQ